MRKKIYKVGVIGAGNIAENFHIPAWLQNSQCQVVALCDINPMKLKNISEKYNIKNCYSNYLKMLRQNDIDIINICTPPNLHLKHIINSLNYNKHILVEKPIVIKGSEIKKIESKLNNENVYLECAYHQRHRPISLSIKKAIQKNLIGKIYYIKILHRKFRGIPTQSKVFSEKKLSGGGPLIDLGSHYFDLISWLLGFPKIKKIFCKTNKEIFKSKKMHRYLPFKKFSNEEISFGNITFEKNLSLNFEIGYALNTDIDETRIEIFGTKGNIVWPEKKFCVLRENKLLKKKFLFKETKASFNQVNSFIKNLNKKKNSKNLEQYKYIVNLIDILYKSAR